MTSILKSAKVVHDVEHNLDFVEIIFDKGNETFMDYLKTKPLADWSVIISKTRSIPYEKFIDTMCVKTLEVRRKMAELALQNIITYDKEPNTYVRLMHTSKILDPTFQPPYINMKSEWQKNFAKRFCKKTLPKLIEECENESRLDYIFNVLKNIEEESW